MSQLPSLSSNFLVCLPYYLETKKSFIHWLSFWFHASSRSSIKILDQVDYQCLHYALWSTGVKVTIFHIRHTSNNLVTIPVTHYQSTHRSGITAGWLAPPRDPYQSPLHALLNCMAVYDAARMRPIHSRFKYKFLCSAQSMTSFVFMSKPICNCFLLYLLLFQRKNLAKYIGYTSNFQILSLICSFLLSWLETR